MISRDYSYSEYVGAKQEEAENRCEIPMREQEKRKVELHDLYRLEM